jgi:hypothetical protein
MGGFFVRLVLGIVAVGSLLGFHASGCVQTPPGSPTTITVRLLAVE